MSRGVPLLLGPAIPPDSHPRETAPGEGAFLGPFLLGRSLQGHSGRGQIEEPVQLPLIPSRSFGQSMNEVAGRLERMAGALRNTSSEGTLTGGAEGQEALDLLITAFALGYHEGRAQAPAVDPPPRSS
jgi:hypothetical protein